MIDVVFLLLVFFMLVARFGQDATLALNLGGGTSTYEGPPRLVTLHSETVKLNGVTLSLDALILSLKQQTSRPGDTIFLQPRDTTSLQQLVDVIDALSAAGFSALVVVEAPR